MSRKLAGISALSRLTVRALALAALALPAVGAAQDAPGDEPDVPAVQPETTPTSGSAESMLVTEPSQPEASVDAQATVPPNPAAGAVEITLIADIATRLEEVSDFAIDGADHTLASDAPGLSVQARIGFGIDMAYEWGIPLLAKVEFEGDVFRGAVAGEPRVAGMGLPGAEEQTADVRKAYGRLSIGPFLTVGGGRMTSQWGLGLVANDGARTWEPGSARFTDPRGGDVVDRVLVATGPVGLLSLTIAGFYDSLVDDDALLPGDEGNQFGLAIRGGSDDGINGGLYIVRRDQHSADGASLDATVFDLTASLPFELSSSADLTVAGELAVITGDTTLAPTFDDPRHDLRQLGAALRGTLDLGGWGFVLDLIYASGDQNFDDAEQNAFKADVNYELGLLAHRYVMGGITGRAPVTASDPDLVGVPSPDLDRYPSRGAISNTFAIFPRGYWNPIDDLEVFGGPMAAFTDVAFADPLATRTAGGGEPRNAFDGEPGRFLGVEIDLGVRYRLDLWITELTVGLEGGVFVPGSALVDRDGRTPDSIWGGRGLAQYRF